MYLRVDYRSVGLSERDCGCVTAGASCWRTSCRELGEVDSLDEVLPVVNVFTLEGV